MANEVLKQFLVSVGFKVDEAGAKRQQEALARTEKQVTSLDRAERDAHAAGGKRATELAQRAESMATAARIAGAGVVAFAAVAGAALLALGTHLQRSLGEFDKLYYTAGRTGASVNNIKALGHAFDQTGSSAGRAMAMLESFAKTRRTNPGVDGLIRSLGVSTKGDAADVLGNALDAAKAKNPYFTAAQIAQQFGISEDDYEHFTRYRKEIGRFREEYKALQKTMGVDGNETASAANRIARAFGSLHATVEVLGDKLTQVLAPVVERVVNLFRDWVASNPERVEAIMRKIAGALEAVGAWLSKSETWDAFAAFWTKLYTGIEKVVSIVNVLLEALYKLGNIFNSGPIKKYFDFMFGGGIAGQLFGGSAQAAEGGGGGGAVVGAAANDTGAEKPGLIRRGWNAVKRGLGIGDNSPPAGSSKPLGAIGRNANAQTIIRTLREAGYNDNAIAAVVGSMQTESSFNPRARNNITGGHTGLWQWDKNRWPRIKSWIERQGGDPADAAWQTKAWMAEHNAKPGDPMYDHRRTQRGGEILRNNPSLGDAIHGVRESERFGAGEEGGRARNAEKWLPVVRQPGSSASPEAPKLPSMARQSFDPSAYLSSRPMGTTSNSTDMSRTLNNNAPVTVNVQGATDPTATASAVARGVSAAGDMNIRNVQTALR
ncbi:hypothetical protein FV219_01525 [Methylobacterium sp. WL122]|nr:hypothetical protein FV219_01525 [Methylobacterium sp. WL122]